MRHGIYAAKVYGCKCETCKLAKKKATHRANNPWMYRPTWGRWRTMGDADIICWPPAGSGLDWKCPTCGEEAR